MRSNEHDERGSGASLLVRLGFADIATTEQALVELGVWRDGRPADDSAAEHEHGGPRGDPLEQQLEDAQPSRAEDRSGTDDCGVEPGPPPLREVEVEPSEEGPRVRDGLAGAEALAQGPDCADRVLDLSGDGETLQGSVNYGSTSITLSTPEENAVVNELLKKKLAG